ncbi:thioredoxin [Thermosyntropha lipolytica DSM 11003]|uniref:Thioredoxin n=1 Tax=Thermosyntropha lipolytica DSM 11003 TaxID=1123382 RepID=A0A1M5MUB9_9FIRM|nr:thioredoxin [Thermosyntropha lipolytica DSM 11003]
MSAVLTLNGGNFENQVLNAEKPVLVDFWAAWCGPCKMLGPIVDAVAEENVGKIVVGKVNVDENRELAIKYGIRGVPTLIFFKDGQEVKRVVGVQSKAQLQKLIDEVAAM